jgi:hypothetical protein
VSIRFSANSLPSSAAFKLIIEGDGLSLECMYSFLTILDIKYSSIGIFHHQYYCKNEVIYSVFRLTFLALIKCDLDLRKGIGIQSEHKTITCIN